MSATDDLDRRLSDWMTEAVASPPPEGRFEEAIQATASRRPRPRWVAAFGSDWVGAATSRRFEWTLPIGRRELLIAAGLALLIAAAIAGAAIVGAWLEHNNQNAIPRPARNGWIAFAEDGDIPPPAGAHYGIYVAAENRPPRRIVGTDSDTVDRVCPAFSPDATRLAFGQVDTTSGTGARDAALVIVDIDADGAASNARTIAVGGPFPAPCPVWSPDGQRVAFSVPGVDSPDGTGNPAVPQPAGAGAVWVVTPDSGQIAKLEDVWAGDLAWSPDGSQLAIATGNRNPHSPILNGGPLMLFTVASGALSAVPDLDRVTSVAWSPDGRRIAYEAISTPGQGSGGGLPPGSRAIWTVAPDGTGATLQSGPFDANQGSGPAWSPDGNRLVYQRVCAHHPGSSAPCREQHDVVLLTPAIAPNQTNPAGSEVVIPPVQLPGTDPATIWWPFAVSWSPDGRKLLYDAWNDGVDVGLVEVDFAGVSAPIVLATTDVADGGAGDFGSGQWVRPFSSWGRLNDGANLPATAVPATERSSNAPAG